MEFTEVARDRAELAEIFLPAHNARGLVLAVSGGPDSMAMLRLAALWRDAGAAPALFVATVDHGLRPDAASEAALVAGWAAAVGLPHATLAWTGAKPASRLQEAAREARYRLLAAHAQARGADMVLLAHHQDDQAETVLFRLLRGSGINGLAGMRALTPIWPLTLFRPFLEWPKARLVAVCAALGQGFVDDPSNKDPRFARTGLRGLAPVLAAQGLDANGLTRLANRAARAGEALDCRAAAVARGLAPPGQEAGAPIDAAPLSAEPEEIVLRVLAILLGAARGGSPHKATRPRLERLERLTQQLIVALRGGAPLAATLAGARVGLDAKGMLRIRAESPRRRGRPEPPPR